MVDDNGEGPGTGAVPTLTIAGGVITAVTFAAGQQGAGYTFPAIFFNDPSGLGSGASADAIVNNSAIFQTNGAAFSPGDVGSVIRTGGGIATVTAFDSDTVVTVNITSPITQVIPNSGWVLQTDSGAYVLVSTTPIPQLTGSWSMDVPVSTISNLNYLAGLTVTGVADGAVITPRVVSAGGEINLDTPATQVIVGLGFQVQIQSPYAPEVSVQGQRKRIARITARVAASRGLKMGANEPDASTLSPPRLVAQWNNLALAPDLGRPNYGSTIPPLFTGDIRIPVSGGFEKRGQAAVQQDNPLPLNLLAFVPEFDEGDLPEGGKGAAKAPEQQQSRAGPLWPGPAGRTSPPWMSA